MLHVGPDTLQDSFGVPMHETTLKAGLLRLNPNLIFDLPGNHALWHPNIERWQNIRLPEKHLSSMDRGLITESDVWTYDPRSNRPIKVLRIGWRTTLACIAAHRLPGLSWSEFCREFKIEMSDRKVVFLDPSHPETPVPIDQARRVQGWQ